jgi:hypothetical protein
MADERFRIFILGAGFSKPAGYPSAPELWREIRRRARLLNGRAAKFQTDLNSFLQYQRDCNGVEIAEETVDFEELCRFLDIEHFLGLRGSDTWSVDGNEGTVVVKTLLGQILAERTQAADEIPDLYLNFARRLQPNDYVLTFNYDILLERALDAVGTRYRLFPNRYETVEDLYAVVGDSRDEVVVLKLHGSIDWFDRGQYSEWERLRRETGTESRPTHPVFGPSGDDLKVSKLLDGPRHADDPLEEMYRVDDVKTLYQRSWMFLAAPWLLAPSTMKILYAAKLADFWEGLGRAGVLNFGLAIIGYSLPGQDDYAKQAVHSIVTNYQTQYWGQRISDKIKTPLVVVDLRRNEEEIREFRDRYRFVDWDRAVAHYDGFDETSLSLVFDGG